MVHIKAYKKDSKILLSADGRSFTIFECCSHARNKCFQLPVIPTANQIQWHCSNGQSVLQPKYGSSSTSVRGFVSAPNFSATTRVRENVWELLNLGLISGYFWLVLQHKIVIYWSCNVCFSSEIRQNRFLSGYFHIHGTWIPQEVTA